MTDRTNCILSMVQSKRASVTSAYGDRFHLKSDIPTSDSHFLSEATKMYYSLINSQKQVHVLQKMIGQISLFNNQGYKIQQLCDRIEDSIKLAQLKLQEMQNASVDNQSGEQIRQILQSRLYNLMQSFKVILQQRTEAMKQNEQKRSQLSMSATIETTDYEIPTFIDTQSQLQSQDNSYLESRVLGAEHVEKQMAELAKMFQQVSVMVHEQQQMVERIDQNTDDALMNLEQGKLEVSKYYESVSSNRNLTVKIFLIFVIFFAFYVVFLL